jgi:hypothetical protein
MPIPPPLIIRPDQRYVTAQQPGLPQNMPVPPPMQSGVSDMVERAIQQGLSQLPTQPPAPQEDPEMAQRLALRRQVMSQLGQQMQPNQGRSGLGYGLRVGLTAGLGGAPYLPGGQAFEAQRLARIKGLQGTADTLMGLDQGYERRTAGNANQANADVTYYGAPYEALSRMANAYQSAEGAKQNRMQAQESFERGESVRQNRPWDIRQTQSAIGANWAQAGASDATARNRDSATHWQDVHGPFQSAEIFSRIKANEATAGQRGSVIPLNEARTETEQQRAAKIAIETDMLKLNNGIKPTDRRIALKQLIDDYGKQLNPDNISDYGEKSQQEKDHLRAKMVTAIQELEGIAGMGGPVPPPITGATGGPSGPGVPVPPPVGSAPPAVNFDVNDLFSQWKQQNGR